MPRILVKIEGGGNGIKTIIMNMVEVSKSLNRTPNYIVKYFGYELGAGTQMTKGRYVVNGAHRSDTLQGILDGFIHRFVLCSECRNPETALRCSKSLKMVCSACGSFKRVDITHKLSTYIMKNPSDTK